jgi:hypothetical protein
MYSSFGSNSLELTSNVRVIYSYDRYVNNGMKIYVMNSYEM